LVAGEPGRQGDMRYKTQDIMRFLCFFFSGLFSCFLAAAAAAAAWR
jgi:hypothetical protein